MIHKMEYMFHDFAVIQTLLLNKVQNKKINRLCLLCHSFSQLDARFIQQIASFALMGIWAAKP